MMMVYRPKENLEPSFKLNNTLLFKKNAQVDSEVQESCSALATVYPGMISCIVSAILIP